MWSIGNCSLFRILNDTQLGELERFARIRTLPKNSAVYTPSDAADGVFLVAAGRVRLCSTTSEGKQTIMALVEPGEIFGEMSLIDPSRREERAETVVPSTIVLLSADRVRQLMNSSIDLTLGITKLIGLRRIRVERRLRSLLFRSNRERLMHLLVDLAAQYGKLTADGLLINIKLSHQELASIIGATRETVTATLGELQQESLVKLGRQRIIIVDPRRLAAGVNLPEPEPPKPEPQSLATTGQVRPGEPLNDYSAVAPAISKALR